jgi:hypothetical protein
MGKAGNSQMPNETYLVRFKNWALGPQLVTAASIVIHGEHLASLRSNGDLSALFLFEVVKDSQEVTGETSRE